MLLKGKTCLLKAWWGILRALGSLTSYLMKKMVPRSESDWLQLEWELGTLFSGAPVAEDDLFAGRGAEVRRMLETVLDRSKHVVLFGERGVGKTSIANVFWKRYNKVLQTVVAARVQADPSDNFSSLWIKALEELQAVSVQTGRADLVPINTAFEQITPDIIRRELQKCSPNSIPIIIIDEFDKLRNREARELTAHVIKSLHDNAATVNTTVILVVLPMTFEN
jgi:Cdc6-like AAA superfamily ATPase